MLKYDIKSVANHLKEEGPNPLFSKLINININYNIVNIYIFIYIYMQKKILKLYEL
jgi:hypothetical protein